MLIHVVQQGDTINSIAEQYGISAERIIQDNELSDPSNLALGQTIVILYPNRTYTVQEGDTLSQIAESQDVPVLQLLRNNPSLGEREVLYPGETLVIDFDTEKLGSFTINGYAYPFIDRTVLRKTLPYLTYLSIFTYGFTSDGELVPTEDTELIQIAKEYQVAPIMVLATLQPDGTFSSEVAHNIFTNLDAQSNLIENIITNMRNKGYVGVDVDFEFVEPADKQGFLNFVSRLQNRASQEGFIVTVALAPKTSIGQVGLLYEAHDYAGFGAIADSVLLMTYEWGYTYGPPMAVAPINKVREVLDFGVTQIPPEKITMGVPNYAYDWPLPFVRGETMAQSMGNVEAVEQAARVGAAIRFDELAQTPTYNYVNNSTGTPVQHEVWFEDARSINAKIKLVGEYGLEGIGIWQIMRYFPQMWLVINSQYDIVKL